ncbi:phytanoyl-CoA dioxygenase, peroxisomal-like [Schistocerca americana]|uniref:phytanoyl-CoA dioxygenase, peroxisomal-like n=1 Tax=Schistocerca americana TaxID=7009 RepID=UPI001F4F1170|nr:phytanoyl-CoA dioxygenase, peroxisomal-like [Schistocerca americana]XP_047001353.1 phytanoyl-CoA dioxygenase, peroxisomal-like [Schistocerca americana]XP_047001354.1 phytanoyl-CoA dioxygenase, peroxisomal-like [Schistocerca americana]XP_047001357.1 phytanoyl-CoA dioxygenase, peroxisomal-like [Schistocerca americana]XP_047108185.1 phytanoyl-CoA dioxygenase, peroxisomal-like [Schistocerca piceifrons]XP_047108193.1 phytanoyl-CoA dioxygenase, peroxisomal-like [Schistocerca piceifrons]XP_047108
MAVDRLKTIQRHLQHRLESPRPTPNLTSTAVFPSSNSEFRYSLDNKLLTYAQRRFYEENGYIVIPGLIEDGLLDECRDHFVDICHGRVDKGNMVLMKDISLAKTGATGEYLYYKAQDILWDEIFAKYITHPLLLDYVECFTGPNIKAMHTMLINKPPDSGKATSVHPAHQDLHYFPFRPADRIVAAWTAMERVTTRNGCLYVLPGTHKGKLLQHDYPDLENGVNKAFHGIKGYDNHPKIFVEMEKGDTVFFHPLLIHGSGINVTQGFRKAISCHYAASDCDYIDVRGTTQENIAQEVLEITKRRGVELTYQDVWKYRSRLVRGQEISL